MWLSAGAERSLLVVWVYTYRKRPLCMGFGVGTEATRVLSLVCMLSLPRRWKQPQLFTVVALALISTLGLIAFTGSHLDAVPSLPRRRHLRTTRLRLRSALEQDDFPEVSSTGQQNEHTFHMSAESHAPCPGCVAKHRLLRLQAGFLGSSKGCCSWKNRRSRAAGQSTLGL